MVHIMMRFHRIKCLPALLLGLTHKLAFFCSILLLFPPPIPHLSSGGNLSQRHASGSPWINDCRWGEFWSPTSVTSTWGDWKKCNRVQKINKSRIKVDSSVVLWRSQLFCEQDFMTYCKNAHDSDRLDWHMRRLFCLSLQTPLPDKTYRENQFRQRSTSSPILQI